MRHQVCKSWHTKNGAAGVVSLRVNVFRAGEEAETRSSAIHPHRKNAAMIMAQGAVQSLRNNPNLQTIS